MIKCFIEFFVSGNALLLLSPIELLPEQQSNVSHANECELFSRTSPEVRIRFHFYFLLQTFVSFPFFLKRFASKR